MKAILFDIDGVLIKSDHKKREIIYSTLQHYNVLEVEWVRDVIELWLNRVAYIQKINEIVPFDTKWALEMINQANMDLENNPVSNPNVVNFIKNNKGKYKLFTNTSLSDAALKRVLTALWIQDCFEELLSFDRGNKVEIINHVMKSYNFQPEEVLFIDDNIKMIEFTKETQAHRLHFNDFDIDIEEYIKKVEK